MMRSKAKGLMPYVILLECNLVNKAKYFGCFVDMSNPEHGGLTVQATGTASIEI
jgi:hypothetical protein